MTSVYEDHKQRAPRPLGLQAAFFPTRKWWKSQTLLTDRCPGSSLWAFVLVSCEVSEAGTLTLQGMLIEGGFSLFPEAVAMPTADNKVRRNLETQLGQKQRGFPSPAPFPEASISPVPAQSRHIPAGLTRGGGVSRIHIYVWDLGRWGWQEGVRDKVALSGSSE